MSVRFTLGTDEVRRNLTKLVGLMPEVAEGALREEAEIELAEAKRRTPVDLGTLRSSGYTRVKRVGTRITAEFGFGGAAAPYAVYVHEDLDAHHTVGQAKFLESTLRESAPYLPQRLRDNIARRARLGG